jgi:D-alanyl-D-alanine carboxypeptidase (penicillin-binding protein 5/6)
VIASVRTDHCQLDTVNQALHNTVVYRDDNTNSKLFDDCYYALLIDDTDKEVYASKNAHRRMYPASMTKLVTASVICDKFESGELSPDDVVTITNSYDLTSEGIGVCDLTPGCRIKVKDLMYGLLLQSNNYYALILAEYVAGDVSSFCKLMNEKAYSIGATNTHFVNPHGLDDPNHYTTAYDIYLIVKEAYSHEFIRTADTYDKYSFSYQNSTGEYVAADVEATNLFMTGYASMPANFHVEVWKTGTTTGAGNCLTMYLTRDDHTYIVVASSGESRAVLYDSIIKLLCLVN